jgi:hypothetical protein
MRAHPGPHRVRPSVGRIHRFRLIRRIRLIQHVEQRDIRRGVAHEADAERVGIAGVIDQA